MSDDQQSPYRTPFSDHMAGLMSQKYAQAAPPENSLTLVFTKDGIQQRVTCTPTAEEAKLIVNILLANREHEAADV